LEEDHVKKKSTLYAFIGSSHINTLVVSVGILGDHFILSCSFAGATRDWTYFTTGSFEFK